MKRDFGRLDIVVHNAGATKRGDFLALTDEDWADGFALKFFAHTRLARAAWPLLKAAGGAVLAIGGNGAAKPTADFTIGSSVNAAVAAFTQGALRYRQARRHSGEHDPSRPCRHRPACGARWKCASPRAARDMAAEIEAYRRELNVPRIGVPDDVAAMAAFILSPRGRWLHGATINPGWRRNRNALAVGA